MKFWSAVLVIVSLLIGSVPVVSPGDNLDDSVDECARTAHLQIYSNAVFIEEAGDVVGYELALQRRSGGSIAAVLYIYEGAPNKDGISVSGRISGGTVMMEGKWILHLVEEPSHKEVVETHSVRIDGTLDSTSFRGSVKIDGFDNHSKIRLKRVDHIWMCTAASKEHVR
jgi:hypothetical protein